MTDITFLSVFLVTTMAAGLGFILGIFVGRKTLTREQR